MKKFLSLLLAVIMAFSVFAVVPTTAGASAETDRIIAQIKSAYSKSLSLSGRSSFNGYCGAYVRYQAMALDIISESDSDVRGDGNKIYGNITKGTTSKGYTKTKYSGNNCINNIVNSNSGNVYNIIVSWTYEYGASVGSPGAGHATFIHAIINGVVYFSESYATRGIPEGGVHTCSISEFYSRYNSSYGNAIGAVHFTKAHPPTDKPGNHIPLQTRVYIHTEKA